MRSLPLAATCILLASAAPLRAGNFPTIRRTPIGDVPNIFVTGEAEERVRPNYALLRLEAADEKPTAVAAAVENANRTRGLAAMLKKYGLSQTDIEASALHVTPLYRNRKNPQTGEIIETTFAGYRASTVYRVKIIDVERAPNIAHEIVNSGNDVYRSVTFEASNREDRLDDLRAKAIRNALQRAQRYAKSAALELGDISQIEPVFQPTTSADEDKDERSPMGQVAFSLPEGATDIILRATVKVSWKLKPQKTECDPDKEQK